MDENALGKIYKHGEAIIRQGEPGDRMYVIQEGMVEVVQEQDGVETILAVRKQGEFFGEMSLFEKEVRMATVRALGSARVLSVDRKTLIRRIHQDPSLAYQIIQSLSQRIRQLSQEVERLESWLFEISLLGSGKKIFTAWRADLWLQFGAAIDMLANAIQACPNELWRERDQPSEYSEFWYIAYHTLFWLDRYLSGLEREFAPPAPFGLQELDPAGLLPERAYTKDELLTYLDYCRKKCRATVEALTDEQAQQRCNFSWGEPSFLELLLYNMRHVQEHASQLCLILGQKTSSAPGWVTKAIDGL